MQTPDNLLLERIPLDQLVLHPENVKQHAELDINNLMESLKEYGWQQFLLVGHPGDNTVYVGNGRLTAARRVCLDPNVPTEKKEKLWFAPCKRGTELTTKQLEAYAVMDNRSSELSTWNGPNLASALKKLNFTLDDLPKIGFDARDLEFYVGPIEGLTLTPLAETDLGDGEFNPREGMDPNGKPPAGRILIEVPYEQRQQLYDDVKAFLERRGITGYKIR